MNAPYTAFGETRMVPVIVYQNGERIATDWWTDTLWVESAEDWYALMSSRMRPNRVRVVERNAWLRATAAGSPPASGTDSPISPL